MCVCVCVCIEQRRIFTHHYFHTLCVSSGLRSSRGEPRVYFWYPSLHGVLLMSAGAAMADTVVMTASPPVVTTHFVEAAPRPSLVSTLRRNFLAIFLRIFPWRKFSKGKESKLENGHFPTNFSPEENFPRGKESKLENGHFPTNFPLKKIFQGERVQIGKWPFPYEFFPEEKFSKGKESKLEKCRRTLGNFLIEAQFCMAGNGCAALWWLVEEEEGALAERRRRPLALSWLSSPLQRR